MSNTWRWIIGILVGLALLGLLFGVRSNRAAYYEARDTYTHRPLVMSQITDATRIGFTCTEREGPIATSKTCGFYVSKR
jgi:hypothetical protein